VIDIENDTFLEVETRPDPTPVFPQRSLITNKRLKACPYCADPDCDNPVFCASYEPPPLDTVPLNALTDFPVNLAKDGWGNALFGNHMLLLLAINGIASSVILYPSERVILGRVRDDQSPDHMIDLTPYNARQHGVSRLHAAISQQGRTLMLTDLDSANGTYLNDQRLLPNQPRILRDGDSILLGNLVAQVHFK
jgi:hypothetical protein